MTQTIWTVICKSEIGEVIYPQDSASTTDKAEAVKWAVEVLENGITIAAIEISDHGIVDVTNDIVEAAAKLTVNHYEALDFTAEEMPDWVKSFDEFAAFAQDEARAA